MDPWEEERSWRDPSAHRLCGAAVTWLNGHQQRKIIISHRSSFLSDNALTYFLSLVGPDAPSRLKLFSKFGNPKALHATDTLREIYRFHLLL
ncbi:hypothetical protein M405DRAFT_808959 [Rhizopogon salebrosus TDB-379]|nr:hypothetical protein M405DRAFT_808959 [Rhizopogon salebrosus TDB-379]